jgi:hypothetical protein
MKEYIFDEEKTIFDIINNNLVDDININKTIRKLARYNHYILNLDADKNYNAIVEYMNKNCHDFSEVGSYSDIKGCIRDVQKSVWKKISNVVITKSELDVIQSLDDIRKEKLAFVLLADAKYDNACKEKQLNLSYLSNSDLYRFSRVTMPIKERNIFLNFLYEKNLVEININPTTSHKKLLYVNDDDDAALVLNENNYKELAFTYANWKSGGYKECKSCGRLFKARTNGQYCKKCAPKYHHIESKTITCVDCGKVFTVDGVVKNKIRCDDCQESHIRQLKTEKQREYRVKH